MSQPPVGPTPAGDPGEPSGYYGPPPTQPPVWDSSSPPPAYRGPQPGYGGPPPGQSSPGYGPYYAPPPAYYAAPPGAPGWYGIGYQAPRPGCVPLRPLGLGDILDGAFKATRRNPRVMLGLSALFAVIQVLLSTVVAKVALSNVNGLDTSDNVNLGPLLGSEGLELVTVFVTLLLNGVLSGLLTVVVTQDVLGRRVGARAVWEQVRPRVWTLGGLALVTSVLEFLGLLACIAPGVWLWGIWAVAVPACIVEKTSVRAALARSRALVFGTFWRVWGIRALGWLVLQVITTLIAVPFLLVGAIVGLGGSAELSDASTAMLITVAVGSLIGQTLVAPVRAGIDALLYVDLRMRREGLDIALQQATAGPATAGPPPMTAG